MVPAGLQNGDRFPQHRSVPRPDLTSQDAGSPVGDRASPMIGRKRRSDNAIRRPSRFGVVPQGMEPNSTTEIRGLTVWIVAFPMTACRARATQPLISCGVAVDATR